MTKEFKGLMAAVFTPMKEDGSLNLDRVPAVVDHLIRTRLDGMYVCGSTGEGPSLTSDERRAAAEAYVKASDGRLPVIVQVGHNSLAEARALAAHAESIGADAVSAVPPSYYKFTEMGVLIDSLEMIASACDLPFYYYHIPALSNVAFDMLDFLARAKDRLATLAGVKYTCSTLEEYQQCVEFEGGRFNILFGRDEMLLAALSMGATGAVGTTYNFAGPLYRRILNAFESGDIERARKCQGLAQEMIRIMYRYRGQAGFKAAMKLIDVDCGPNRLPMKTLANDESARMKAELTQAGFFDWALSGI